MNKRTKKLLSGLANVSIIAVPTFTLVIACSDGAYEKIYEIESKDITGDTEKRTLKTETLVWLKEQKYTGVKNRDSNPLRIDILNNDFWDYFPNTTIIKEDAFKGFNFSTMPPIPARITKIHKGAFSSNNLKSVTFEDTKEGEKIAPTQLTYIGQSAFAGNSLLSTIRTGSNSGRFPDTLNVIDRWAFSGTAISGTMVFPKSITDIKTGAFFGTSITRLSLPDTIKNIERDAFKLSENTSPYRIKLGKNTMFGAGRKFDETTGKNVDVPGHKYVEGVPSELKEGLISVFGEYIYRSTEQKEKFRNLAIWHDSNKERNVFSISNNYGNLINIDTTGIDAKNIFEQKNDWNADQAERNDQWKSFVMTNDGKTGYMISESNGYVVEVDIATGFFKRIDKPKTSAGEIDNDSNSYADAVVSESYRGITLSADEKKLYTISSTTGTVIEVDLNTGLFRDIAKDSKFPNKTADSIAKSRIIYDASGNETQQSTNRNWADIMVDKNNPNWAYFAASTDGYPGKVNLTTGEFFSLRNDHKDAETFDKDDAKNAAYFWEKMVPYKQGKALLFSRKNFKVVELDLTTGAMSEFFKVSDNAGVVNPTAAQALETLMFNEDIYSVQYDKVADSIIAITEKGQLVVEIKDNVISTISNMGDTYDFEVEFDRDGNYWIPSELDVVYDPVDAGEIRDESSRDVIIDKDFAFSKIFAFNNPETEDSELSW